MKYKAFRSGITLLAITTALMGCGSGNSDSTGPSNEVEDKAAYRMFTQFIGDEMALAATALDDGTYTFKFDTIDDLNRNQRWVIENLGDDYYRIYNDEVGGELSLDIVNDGVFDKLKLGATDDVSGQLWRITELADGNCRLTNQFLTDEVALDVTSDTDTPTLTMRSVDNVSGQQWQLEQVAGSAEDAIDVDCIAST